MSILKVDTKHWAVSALEENLDIKIDDYATFNWKSVAEAINILGGIDLEITPAEI